MNGSEYFFASGELEGLLPDEDIVVLPRIKRVSGGLAYCFVKRLFDIAACSFALVVLAFPMLLIAVKIKSESPGPAIYVQCRAGKGGRVFELYKFRSLYADAEAQGARWVSKEDSRITLFGHILRNSRLASIIIGTPGDGEPTKSFSHPANFSLDLQFCERRLGTSLGARHHYASFQFLSFAFFGGSRKSQNAFAARVNDVKQNGFRSHREAFYFTGNNGISNPSPALGVAA